MALEDVSWQFVLQVVLTLCAFVISILVLTKLGSVQTEVDDASVADEKIKGQIQSAISAMSEVATDADLMPDVQNKVTSVITTLTNVSNTVGTHGAVLGAIAEHPSAGEDPSTYVVMFYSKLWDVNPATDKANGRDYEVDFTTKRVTFLSEPWSTSIFSGARILDSTEFTRLADRGYSFCQCMFYLNTSVSPPVLGHSYPGGWVFSALPDCRDGRLVNSCSGFTSSGGMVLVVTNKTRSEIIEAATAIDPGLASQTFIFPIQSVLP